MTNGASAGNSAPGQIDRVNWGRSALGSAPSPTEVVVN
jgi:hypothetical protein